MRTAREVDTENNLDVNVFPEPSPDAGAGGASGIVSVLFVNFAVRLGFTRPANLANMPAKDLTQGSVLKNMVGFSLPYLLSYFMQLLYGLVDLFVIGLYDGVASTTAVSIGSQFMPYSFRQHPVHFGRLFSCTPMKKFLQD